MNDLIATVGKIMHKAIWTRGAAVTWMKDTEAKAPGKKEGLFSFWFHTIRISTILSFRKPINEKR